MSRVDAVVGILLGGASLILIGALIVLSTRSHDMPWNQAAALSRPVEIAEANPEEAIETAAKPAEVPLVENAEAITRPDSPSRIVIGSISLDAKVVEVGIVVENGKPVWDTAAFAVGYHRGTALPGTRGNTVMAGHISSPVTKKGDIFKRLPEVRIGDRIEVYAGERRVSYQVSEVRVVPPTAVQVMNPTSEPTLTLITCYPDQEYSHRLVVIATLAGSTERAEQRP